MTNSIQVDAKAVEISDEELLNLVSAFYDDLLVKHDAFSLSRHIWIAACDFYEAEADTIKAENEKYKAIISDLEKRLPAMNEELAGIGHALGMINEEPADRIAQTEKAERGTEAAAFGDDECYRLLKRYADTGDGSFLTQLGIRKDKLRLASLESRLQAANAKIGALEWKIKGMREQFGLAAILLHKSPERVEAILIQLSGKLDGLLAARDQPQPASQDSRDSIALTGQENDSK